MAIYNVRYKISGYAMAQVEAETQEQAENKAEHNDVIGGSDEVDEWSFEDVVAVDLD